MTRSSRPNGCSIVILAKRRDNRAAKLQQRLAAAVARRLAAPSPDGLRSEETKPLSELQDWIMRESATKGGAIESMPVRAGVTVEDMEQAIDGSWMSSRVPSAAVRVRAH